MNSPGDEYLYVTLLASLEQKENSCLWKTVLESLEPYMLTVVTVPKFLTWLRRLEMNMTIHTRACSSALYFSISFLIYLLLDTSVEAEATQHFVRSQTLLFYFALCTCDCHAGKMSLHFLGLVQLQ